MNGNVDASGRRNATSKALAVVGALLALLGGALLYSREELLEPLAARINSLKSLVGRSRLCERIRGLAPNLLAVDYYDRGNVLGVANVLNGLAADSEPAVRTLP